MPHTKTRRGGSRTKADLVLLFHHQALLLALLLQLLLTKLGLSKMRFRFALLALLGLLTDEEEV
jgi:hypothetical protein